MKKLIVLFAVIALPLLSVSTVSAETISASISSQIHEAFGREILGIFEEASGIRVKSHIFSSTKCIERLKNDSADIAGVTIKLSKEDRDNGFIEIPICEDSLVIIADPDCGVKNLSLVQVRRLFSGYIKNWKEIGGADKPVVKIIPARDTGAYMNFKRLAMGPADLSGDLVATKAATSVICVRNIPGAISFISNGIALKYDNISLISIDGVSSDSEEYPLHQLFSMVIKGKTTPVIKEVIKFLTSEVGFQIMEERGLRPVFK